MHFRNPLFLVLAFYLFYFFATFYFSMFPSITRFLFLLPSLILNSLDLPLTSGAWVLRDHCSWFTSLILPFLLLCISNFIAFFKLNPLLGKAHRFSG